MEQVEQVQLQGNLLLGSLDPVDASEASHEVLEREGLAIRVHSYDLALQQELGGGEGLRDRDDLGQAIRDVAQTAAEDADPVALPMDLNASGVELVLDRGLPPRVPRGPRPNPRPSRRASVSSARGAAGRGTGGRAAPR